MVRINLLPHRQIKRAAKQREFGWMAVFSAVLAAAFVFVGWTYLSSRVQTQLERNARLEQAIAQLDVEIADISKLKEQINNVLERKQIVENLQTNRNQAVVVLDELARQLPQGLYLKSIKQEGMAITMQGVADTNARVATEVRNLDASGWLENPVLVEIKTSTVNNAKRNDFTMKVNLKPQLVESVNEQTKPRGGQS
ncbi:MAG: type IV pilus assembly protein PilN [Methylophilaceae bacterium]|jgi:type IV pilus assembly protein PilN